jgi:hypothetical protein
MPCRVGLLFEDPTSKPPWPLRCYGLLLGYRSLLGIDLLPGPRSLSSVNLAHSLGNPLSTRPSSVDALALEAYCTLSDHCGPLSMEQEKWRQTN